MSQAPDPELGLERLSTCLDTAWENAAGPDGSRSLRVRVLAAELDCGKSLAAGRAERALGRLLDELGEEPHASRLRLLEPLARCRAPEVDAAALASARERTSALFPVADDYPGPAATGERAGSENEAWRRLTLAELYRVVGDTEPMVKLRDRAVSTLGQRDAFVRWQGLDAVWRVGAPRAIRPLDPDDFAKQYRGYPALISAALTTWIEAYDAGLRSPESEDLLGRARELAERASNVSQYSVRLLTLLEKQARAHGREEEADRLNDERSRLQDRLGVRRFTAWLPRTVDGGQIVIRDTAAGFRISTVGYATEEIDVPAEKSVWDDEGTLSCGTGVPRALERRLAARSDAPTVVGFSWSTATLAAQPWELLSLQSGPLFRAAGVSDVVRHDAKRGPEQYRIRLLHRAMAAYWSATEGTRSEFRAVDGGASRETRAFDAAPGKQFELALRRFADEQGLAWSAAGPERDRIENAALVEAVAFFRRKRASGHHPLRVRIAVPAVGNSMSALSIIEQRVRQVDTAYQKAARAGGHPKTRDVTVKCDYGPEVFATAVSYESSGSRRPCDILHLCGPLGSVEGLPLIGVPRDGAAVSERELDSLIRACADMVPPVVVLDLLAPTSSSPDEVRRQLAQRNMFAHRLLALGGADTVIATGFERPAANHQPKTLAAIFTDGGTPATACRAIRSSTPSASAALPYEATALFSGLQPQLIFEPGLFVGD